jgi:hypothetical protein
MPRRVAGVETLSLRHHDLGSFAMAREWTDWAPLPYAFAAPILESLPVDLLEVAKRVRSENHDLSERIIQRRIRDALDREKAKVGPVQMAGLDAASEAIEGTF